MDDSSAPVALEKGARVRLLKMPPKLTANREQFPETWKLVNEAVAVGGIFAVRGINDLAMAELWISEYGLNSDNACDDSVWIEGGLS